MRAACLFATGLVCVVLSIATPAAWSHECKPGHFRPPYFIKTMGRCTFDPATLSFQGEPAEQARCLMRGMDQSRNLAPPLESLPRDFTPRPMEDSGFIST